jgi:hypothetical protein
MREIRSGPGKLRRVRHWLLPLAGAVLALALALPGRPVHGSAIRGFGTSWQPVSDVIAADHGTPRRRRGSHKPGPRGTFRIGGSIGGLYPGVVTHLVLSVVNPQRYALVITSISTTVGTPKTGCSATNLSVGSFSGHVKVKAHRSVQVAVQVSLAHAAPDACQGALFPLQYSGLGRRA